MLDAILNAIGLYRSRDVNALIDTLKTTEHVRDEALNTVAKLQVNHNAVAGQLRETTDTLHALQKTARGVKEEHETLKAKHDELVLQHAEASAALEASNDADKLPVVTGLCMQPTANVGKVTAWSLCLEAVSQGQEVVLTMRTLAASAKSRKLLEADGEEFARVLDVPFKASGL